MDLLGPMSKPVMLQKLKENVFPPHLCALCFIRRAVVFPSCNLAIFIVLVCYFHISQYAFMIGAKVPRGLGVWCPWYRERYLNRGAKTLVRGSKSRNKISKRISHGVWTSE